MPYPLCKRALSRMPGQDLCRPAGRERRKTSDILPQKRHILYESTLLGEDARRPERARKGPDATGLPAGKTKDRCGAEVR